MSVAQSPDRKAGGSGKKAVSPQVQMDPQYKTNAKRLPSEGDQRPVRPELGPRSTSFRSSSSQHNPSNTKVDVQAIVSLQFQNSGRMSRKLSQHTTSSISSRSLNRTASNANCPSPPASRRPSTPSASHTHQIEEGLSCNEHEHTCLPCAQNLAAYAPSQSAGATGLASSDKGSPPAKGLFRKALRGNRQGNTGSTAARALSSALQKSASCALDACAVCGVALGLSLVATDYVCILAGGIVGLLFVPAGMLLEMLGGMGDPLGRCNLARGAMMPLRISGAVIGITGKFLPFIIPSVPGWFLGEWAADRLKRSKRISQQTAETISKLLFPGIALLRD